jgi:hypothetical protein
VASLPGSIDGASLTSRKFERLALARLAPAFARSALSGDFVCGAAYVFLHKINGFPRDRARHCHRFERLRLREYADGCAGEDELVGLSELELETCLGLPDKEATKGKTTLLSYNATSARTVNLSIPIVNGIGVSLAAYCRAIFRLENGRGRGCDLYRRRRSA